jgi:hypothetical protein
MDGANDDESEDIVVRDQNGEVELGDLETPPVDEVDEEQVDPALGNERERQRLAQAVKQHQIDQNSVPAQPEGMHSPGNPLAKGRIC